MSVSMKGDGCAQQSSPYFACHPCSTDSRKLLCLYTLCNCLRHPLTGLPVKTSLLVSFSYSYNPLVRSAPARLSVGSEQAVPVHMGTRGHGHRAWPCMMPSFSSKCLGKTGIHVHTSVKLGNPQGYSQGHSTGSSMYFFVFF